jgi:hypothetical protein
LPPTALPPSAVAGPWPGCPRRGGVHNLPAGCSAAQPSSLPCLLFGAGIEEIGVSIEEPFSILPLEGICRGIEDSVRGMAATHSARQGRSRRWAQTSPAPAPHAPQQVAELLQRGARRSNVNSLPAGLFASQPINGGQ